jgi:hypothetical protein
MRPGKGAKGLLRHHGLAPCGVLECFSRAIAGVGRSHRDCPALGLFWRRLEGVQINQRQRKALRKLLEAGPAGFEGGLTNKKYRAMTQASQATAARDLAELVACGALRRTGGGRSVRYELAA